MTGTAATVADTIVSLQAALSIISSVDLTAWRYPTATSIADGTCFDFIVVGGGTAGCVVANRLSENYTVALIEAGPVPPLETWFTGTFPVSPESSSDWNRNTTDDSYTAQNLKNNVVSLTAGKMLGGSSGLNHGIMVNGTVGDYARWALAANDSAWNYTNLQPYVKKILNINGNSKNGGLLKITKEPNTANNPYIKSLIEMGYTYTDNADANQNGGVENPYLAVYDSWRYSAADAYISPIKNRTNLSVMYSSTVIKINFNSSNVATGVQVIDSSGNNITICVNREVIVTAGAINSPHLLLLSGVGPADNLEDNGITVVSDVPVGAKLRDHPSASVTFVTETTTASTTPVNYGEFPVPVLCVYNSSSTNSKMSDYQMIPLLFPPASSALCELCTQVFKYKDSICDCMYDASASKNLWYIVTNLLHPASTGNLTLQSADYTVPPKIYHGIYSNKTDLTNMAKYLLGMYTGLMNTSYFIETGAGLVDLNLTECSGLSPTTIDFWEQYAVAISGAMWHFSGTCAMGSVTDNKLKVKGVSGVRVCDAAAMPDLTSGNIEIPVLVIAEKCADLVMTDAAR